MSAKNIPVGINGSSGKMGKMLRKAILQDGTFYLSAARNTNSDTTLQTLCKMAKIIFDFSSPKGTIALLEETTKHSTKVIIGTTGFNDKQMLYLKKMAKKNAILYAPNTTIGATALALASKAIEQILPSSFDTTILDIHHKDKKDAPSGTALMISQQISRTHDHTTIRAGKSIGEHQVMFFGEDEEITLSHKVTSRKPFALGAIKAAKWLLNKESGSLYSMQDVFL
ncbi:4-hydroxy-tetrahydrodipicolinate reductase [Candidatus Sneabacter namystus]|uniref:4-hydroxy-tetrahydrodipicolinate reductase n=1 Tax=Candidatus Sneabacter namystus TaxID=2601646 RepID=A0A5C0UKU2_9RICK|nr:dihydrodipicolinate reductase C-terminal domain-containing protein [Candidatus Sneabacter namystus]QEK39474.1 4-hydroxy-tetrahydrodipicolinate reductase [Candidatus Sneabacter namystus]